jgi:hypothetical protein
MIHVPNLRWRTFRYRAVGASDVRGTGSSPEEEHWVIPLTDFDLKNTSRLTADHLQACFNLTASRFQLTSSIKP